MSTPLAVARERLGFSQSALADRLGMAQASISRLERVPALDRRTRLAVRQLAADCGVDVSDIQAFSPPANPATGTAQA